MLNEGRVQILLDATYDLARRFPDVPVIGSVTGPVSTAASIVDPMIFLKELRKDASNAHKVMDYVTDFLIEYARALVESGAHIISIADPTATGEILGPKMFNEYAVSYISRLVDAIHAMNTQVIVHICGHMDPVKHLIPDMKADVISTDAMVSLKALKDEYPDLVTMGNLSTIALQNMSAGGISDQTRRLMRDGIDIIAPACGLSTTTPIENIVSMTSTVKETESTR
jgi:[methyl-Co(III) methanol-specific corrinoid protein]:coenzyme M methyltransferase